MDRIWFVMRAQRLRFMLEEIADLSELRLRPGDACGPAQEAVEATFAEIDRKLDELRPVGRTGPSCGGGIL